MDVDRRGRWRNMNNDGIESSADATPTNESTDDAAAAPAAAARRTLLSALARRAGRSSALAHDERPGSHEGSDWVAPFGWADSIEWQRLWLATQRRRWSSLAVVPAGRGIPSARIARALAEVGSCHIGPTIIAVDARTLTLTQLQATIDAWIDRSEGVQRVLIALDVVLENPAGLALAQACDAAILCLRLGEDSIPEATRTIEEVGRDRFLGSVILRRDGAR